MGCAVLYLVAQSRQTLCDPMVCSLPGSSVHADSPGKNTGVVAVPSSSESSPGLPHARRILYCLSHQGGPWILEWVAYPFSRGSSRPSNRTGSPALQADSLPAELLGKPRNGIYTVKFAIWVRETQKTQSRTIAVSRCRSNWARIPKVPYLREESVLKTSDSWLHPLGHLSLSTRLLRGQIWKGHWRI